MSDGNRFDPKRLAEEAAEKLAQQAAKRAASDALDSLTLTPEERAKRAAAADEQSRLFWIKVIAGGVVAVVVGVTLLRLFAKLWGLVVFFCIVGGIGAIGYLTLKPKLTAWQAKRAAAVAEKNAAKEAAALAARAEEQKLLVQKKLDDDLARLKKQL